MKNMISRLLSSLKLPYLSGCIHYVKNRLLIILSYPLIYLFIRYLYFCNPRYSWPFQLVWFFDRSALIRVFEAERTGGCSYFDSWKSISGSEPACPTNSLLDAKKERYSELPFFWLELDRRFWGTSGIRSVSIEGKVRCWFLRRFVRAEFDSGKIPYWFDAAGFGRWGDARMCRIQEKQECQNLHIW